ncbi:hypothetical protein VNI00_014231 [Paramarasmius palmivorus]|uniref:Uncharacterized protein n=1 Tax=Paramarasmius palmivorus TaxID=297713 RepID=A0AAW0BUW3_9AGAR
MTPFTYAPATLGLKIVLVTTAIIAFFTLSGLALYRLRASMASRRPVDVEAAVAQTHTQSVSHLALLDTPSRLICARTGVDPSVRSDATLSATPDSMFSQKSPETVQPMDPALIASSSFEGWAASLCDLIEEFASGERTRESGLVTSSSFEVWAANLCDLISDFASPAPFRSGFTPLVDTFEDDPYIFDSSYDNIYEPTANLPDIIVTAPSLPQIAEDTYESYEPALVSSPSFMDLAAECVEELDDDSADTTFVIEDDVEIEDDIPEALADELLDASIQHTQDEPVSSLSLRYGSILSTSPQPSVSGCASKQTNNYTTQYDDSQYLSPSSALSLPLVVEEPIVECEPEETLKSVFESDSEDDDTYYSRRPHLSRPKQPSPSMSSMLRAIVEKRKAQQSRRKESSDKENGDHKLKKRSRPTTSKPGLFSRTLAIPSEPRNPIKVPTIRFTPPTPPRRFSHTENEDVGTDSETDEVVERFAFDLVFDDYGRCFF